MNGTWNPLDLLSDYSQDTLSLFFKVMCKMCGILSGKKQKQKQKTKKQNKKNKKKPFRYLFYKSKS